MRVGEVVKALRFVRDVLVEYVATEKHKREVAARHAAETARRRAEEAARKAEEAAAREAELKAAQERLLARQPKPTGRRRRGDAPLESTPLRSIHILPVDAVYNVSEAPPPSPPGGLPEGLPPGIVALLTQLQALDGALRDLFTVTDKTRAWFERIQADPRWGPLVVAASMAVSMLAPWLSSKMYRRSLLAANRREWDENYARVQQMFDGDWREKIRYMLWTNGQRQARQALAARSQVPTSAGLAPAMVWG
jgi:hypothetical protein